MKPDSRYHAALYYGLPMLFCLAVHWITLKTWFFLDDFAWLGLPLELHSPRDLVHILFAPEAQGTIRTISERLFFLIFSAVFGLHAPPFRIWAFLTQFANIVLLAKITRGITGSDLAGLLAPVLWSANAGLAMAIGWSSAYNEIALAFFVLLAFYLFLRYIETGERKFWIGQWIAFLAGFGALELNVVYPVLAAGYSLSRARTYFRKTLWLFVPSILFAAAHFTLVPPPSDPYYQMHFGKSLFKMLWIYWAWTLGSLRDSQKDWRPLWLGLAIAIAITIALASFAWRKLREGKWLAVFLLGWFVVVILPVLPLKNHFTEYYVTVPAIGLAILGAWSITESRGVYRAAAVALAGLYLVVSISDTHLADKFNYERSRRGKYLVVGLEALPKQGAGKKIFLAGIDNDLFWRAVYPDPFRLIGFTQVYLVPGSEKAIDPHPEWGGMARFTMPLDDALLALKSHQGLVFELQGKQLRDVTNLYLSKLEQQLGGREVDFVDVADPRFANNLGAGWYPAESGFRWMGKTATVKIARPKRPGQTLKITGYCPAVAVRQGPLEVTFRADDTTIGTANLKGTDQNFDLQFAVPTALIGASTMEIQIEVSRTFQAAPDPRELGLVFGTFTLK